MNNDPANALQSTMRMLTWAPLLFLIPAIIGPAIMLAVGIWLRKKFPRQPTKIEITVKQAEDLGMLPRKQTPPINPHDDSKYMPKG